MLRRRTFWKGGVGFWSRNRKFWKGRRWSRIFYLRHCNPDIYMYQLILLLLHAEPQARAKHDFDLQLNVNIYFFLLPFWGFCCEFFTFLLEIYFCFFNCFSSEMSLWIAQQPLICWKTRLGFLKCFTKPRWWWDKILASLAYFSNSVSVHSWTWPGVVTCKWSLLEKFINHLVCRLKITNISWSLSRKK